MKNTYSRCHKDACVQISIGNTEWLLCYKSVSQTCFSGEKTCFHRERWLRETPLGPSSRPRKLFRKGIFCVLHIRPYCIFEVTCGPACNAGVCTNSCHLVRFRIVVCGVSQTSTRACQWPLCHGLISTKCQGSEQNVNYGFLAFWFEIFCTYALAFV